MKVYYFILLFIFFPFQFAFAIFFTLALALGVQSSWIPEVVGGGLSYTAVSPSWSAWGAPWGGPWAGAWGGPWAPSVAVHAAPIAVGEGTYVAKTRGALHTAPLAGHINSVANVNVAPAPGTI